MKNSIINMLLLFGIVSVVMCSGCKKDNNSNDSAVLPSPNVTGSFIDTRDNKSYDWVKIGSQVWMAENFAFKVDTGGSWAYNNDTNNVQGYGYLYNWWTAKAATPSGWHLPTSDEWVQLNAYLEDNGYSYDGNVSHDYIGKSMATKTGWDVSTVEGSVGNTDYPDYRNLSGFSAVPTGSMDDTGKFFGLGEFTYFWSDTEISNSDVVFTRFIHSNMRFNQAGTNFKSMAYPVRYVRD